MLFDVASSMFRCHTDLITSNGVPATQANPPRIVIIEYLFPERSNHFFLPFDFHSFSTLSLYTYIYICIQEEIFMEISEFFNSASRDPRNLLAGIWKEEEVEGGSQGGKEE